MIDHSNVQLVPPSHRALRHPRAPVAEASSPPRTGSVAPTSIHALRQDKGLGVRRRQRQRRVSTARVVAPQATRPNERWAMDCMADQRYDGLRFRRLSLVDTAGGRWAGGRAFPNIGSGSGCGCRSLPGIAEPALVATGVHDCSRAAYLGGALERRVLRMSD